MADRVGSSTRAGWSSSRRDGADEKLGKRTLTLHLQEPSKSCPHRWILAVRARSGGNDSIHLRRPSHTGIPTSSARS